MKLFTVALSALLAGIVSAQTFSALPQCAQNCTINAIPSSCNLNPKCICEDAGFIKAITCCVAQVCDAADQETTIKYADSICVPAGVTNLPTAATCANSTATSTASSTTGSAVLSNSLTTSAASAASSVEASISSVASSAVASVSSAASAAATATGTAGRNYMAQGMGVMGAAALAAAALM